MKALRCMHMYEITYMCILLTRGKVVMVRVRINGQLGRLLSH